MKIGIISDTHHKEPIYSLPSSVKNAFAGVNLIIHAGDITNPSVIKELEKIAPVKVIRGNKKGDQKNFRNKLPREIVFSVNGLKLAVIHCTTNRLKKEVSRCLSLLGLQEFSDRLLIGDLFFHFRNHCKIDCIIFGDTHKPFCKKIGETLFLNPGAAYPTSKRLGSVLTLEIKKSKSIIPTFTYFFPDPGKNKAIQT